MVDEAWLASLRKEAELRAAELTASIEAWNQGDPATRERWRLDRARMLAQMSVKRLKEAEGIRVAEERRAALLAQRRIPPPSLQDLVLAHGTYDKITQEAWATFNVEMAEWKAKLWAGESYESNSDPIEMRKRG